MAGVPAAARDSVIGSIDAPQPRPKMADALAVVNSGVYGGGWDATGAAWSRRQRGGVRLDVPRPAPGVTSATLRTGLQLEACARRGAP